MLIKNLKSGTKLIWDAPSNNVVNPTERIIYPAIVGEKHYDQPWVKIISGKTANWMGPFQQYLRYPTHSELNEFNWPEFK